MERIVMGSGSVSRRFLARLLLTAVVAIPLGSADKAEADCSVIAPEGFDQRAELGAMTSPFLTPGLTNDIKVIGAVCEQQERSTAADFRVGGIELEADELVVTIAFVGSPGTAPPPLLVLGSNPDLCGSDSACRVDAVASREIARIPLPGGGEERRLRFRTPEDLAHFGPVRVGVKLASDPQPVAFGLRTASCDVAAGSFVACIDRFYALDGSCRTGEQFVNRPFSGLVALPKTDFTSICTEGCEDVAAAPTRTTLPITIDREGNAMFAMIYADQLVRADRGDGQIEPRPRRLGLSLADAAANGFTDDAPPIYEAKPSSYTFEGFPLSPPFNPFVDPTVQAGEIGIWGMADAEATVHFLPRRACSDDPARACFDDGDCASGARCGAAEYGYASTTSAIQLPIASAVAQQAVELNSWLDGSLDDDAVALAEDERLAGKPLNADDAADDVVVELLDRGTGLIKRLSGLLTGRGLTQVRVVSGDQDFVRPAVAAEDRTLAFLESEFAEGLAYPLESTTSEEAIAADTNGNARLDQNLRVFSLPDDPAAAAARSLLPADLDLAVLPDARFDGGQSLVLSDGRLYFAYSPIARQPHAYQLVNRSTSGEPASSFAGEVDLSSDGRFITFVSGADDLYVPGPVGALDAITSGGTRVQAVTGPNGEFPVVRDGRSFFEYRATDDARGPLPSSAFLELKLCNTNAGEPDLVALVDLALTGPNAYVQDTSSNCPECSFPGSKLVEFNRGLGKGKSQTYLLVLDAPEIPAGEIGVAFKASKSVERTTIRGPACVDPSLLPDVARVYLRDVQSGSTRIVSVQDRASCSERAVASDLPSGNPDVSGSGSLVFFDSEAGLAGGDLDGTSDVYLYDSASCHVANLTSALSGPSSNPTSSDDGRIVAFESGQDPEIVVLDRATGELLHLGSGRDPNLSADGSKVVYSAMVGGSSQVFLVDLAPGASRSPVAVSVVDGGLFPSGAGSPSVSNGARVVFEAPPLDEESQVFLRDVPGEVTIAADTLPTNENVCTLSPCGAFSPSISDDGRFVAFVLRGLEPIDEIVIKDLVTGSITPLTRMAGADADSLEPSLGASGDFVALASFASRLGLAAGIGSPNVFLEAPIDPGADRRALLGVLDVATCGSGPCTPILTSEPVTKAATYQGDVAVVGSPVRVIERGQGGGVAVHSFGRQGVDVALGADWVCAVVEADASGGPGHFAACGRRDGSTLADLTVANRALPAREIGLCGDRAIALGTDGVLYAADLSSSFEAWAVQAAQDFELGEGTDDDGDGRIDSCLVAFRTPESLLGGSASQVGNRDLDTSDLAMFVFGRDGVVTDCRSSATDCPGQACAQFNYQVGRESVVYLVDELDENFGSTPEQDACSPGRDVNADGLCDVSVRRCTAAGSLTEGTSFGLAGNLFSGGGFPDGENTVVEAGFCGTDPSNIRLGQLCVDDLDCLAQPGETCQRGFTLLSALADSDGDEIPDVVDNCPFVPNPDQANSDVSDPSLTPDAVGDACDTYTCGDSIVQSAETCDEGATNGEAGSSCTATCGCGVRFEVLETLNPGANGNTPTILFGSAAANGSGCLNLDTKVVGGIPAKSIDPTTLRLSASVPALACPTTGGAPTKDLVRGYRSFLEDYDSDGIIDLRVQFDTPGIGGDASTQLLYLTGRFSETAGGGCFVSTAPVRISNN